MKKIIEEIKRSPVNSKLYLGADSTRNTDRDGVAWARVTVVAVIHLGGRHGCKVIGETSKQRVYDTNLGRPNHRMMLECYTLGEFYINLVEALIENELDIPIEVHLDIASDPLYGSNCAAKQAAGYIMGVCGIQPKLKPEAWAASTAADLFPKKLLA